MIGLLSGLRQTKANLKSFICEVNFNMTQQENDASPGLYWIILTWLVLAQLVFYAVQLFRYLPKLFGRLPWNG